MTYYSTRRRPDYQTRPTGPTVWIVIFIADVLALAAALGWFIAALYGGR